MDLFLEVLRTFTNELTIETKALGLLNNIAEVRELHHKLMDNDFIAILRYGLELSFTLTLFITIPSLFQEPAPLPAHRSQLLCRRNRVSLDQ